MQRGNPLIRHVVSNPSYALTKLVAPYEAIGRTVIFVALTLMYSGVERYFWRVSTALHYSFDALLLLAVGLLLPAQWGNRRAWRLLPYGFWIGAYYLWGVTVSPIQSSVLPMALSQIVLNLLILAAVGVAVSDRDNVGRFALYLQYAVWANCAVALVQYFDWPVLASMAHFLNPSTTSYNIHRPAGLWIDPNLAGIGYLFAFLMSFLARGPRIVLWLSRLAAILGMYLTGSRGGMYPLVFSAAVLGVMWLYNRRQSLRSHVLTIGGSCTLLLLVGVVFVGSIYRSDVPGGYALNRFLDASLRGTNDPSRVEVGSFWLSRALHGPWYGSGVFSYQGNGLTQEGAHDVFLTVWGETGLASLAIYLTVLGLGIAWAIRARIPARERGLLMLMWLDYLLEGFTWHNQFSAVVGIIVIGLLYRLPAALQLIRTHETSVLEQLSAAPRC
jgi:hypothetical protein